MKTQGYSITSSSLGDMFVVHGSWNKSKRRALEESGALRLHISIDHAFDCSDFAFLEEIPFIEYLRIRVRRVLSFAPIMALPRLRGMQLGEQGSAVADFTASGSLEVLSLDRWSSKRYGSALHCRRLRRFLPSGLPASDLAPLAELTNLELLNLTFCKVETLTGLGPKPLRALYLSACSRLRSFRGIEDAGGLEKVVVYQGKSLESLEGMEALLKLKYLSLNQCPKLLSLRPLGRLPQLEVVGLLGSTSVADGDMSPLTTLPRLGYADFREREHYTHPASAFPRNLPPALPY